MTVVVLTTLRHGIASHVLPALAAAADIRVAGVVFAGPGSPDKRRDLVRRLRKTARIGVLGAGLGFWLRRWYADTSARDIEDVCRELNLPCWPSPCVNCEDTRRLFRDSHADLGLSLGNGYIGRSVFSVPHWGMVNLHTELLPHFRGGVHSIIWPIHEGRDVTGFALHQVDATSDTGNILHQEVLPIDFRATLRETVEATTAIVRARVPAAIVDVCRNFETLAAHAVPQGEGRTFMTPSAPQFLRMLRTHRRMYRDRLSAEGRA